MLGFRGDKEQLLRLFVEIQKQKEIATSQGKPLLILMGEAHHSLSSYYSELCVIFLIKELFATTDLLLELDNDKINSFKINKHIYENSNARHGNMQSLFYKFNKETSLHLIPIDLGASKSHLDNVTMAGVRRRNKIMSKIASEKAKRDAIGIVGYNHLYGLLCETKLSKYFHVFSINTSNHKDIRQEPYGHKCSSYALGSNVFQLYQAIPEGCTAKEVEEMALADVRNFISTHKHQPLEMDVVEMLSQTAKSPEIIFSLSKLLEFDKENVNMNSLCNGLNNDEATSIKITP